MEILHFSDQCERALFLQHVNGIRCFGHSVSFSGPIMVQVEFVSQVFELCLQCFGMYLVLNNSVTDTFTLTFTFSWKESPFIFRRIGPPSNFYQNWSACSL